MDKQSDLLMNISVLHRSTQKYYDRMLQSMNLTYAQLPILIMIYEQEGVSMRQIAQSGVYDKGTISKSVKHLEQQGYITIQTSKQDKRNKELYTTDFAKQTMARVYSIRRNWWQHLIHDMPLPPFQDFLGSYEKMAQNARQYAESTPSEINIFGWKKLSLSRYPDHLSTVFYVAGSNFRCPFDLHPQLIFIQEGMSSIPLQDIRSYLKRRRGTIQAVCIEGGEPLMNEHLPDFLREIKELGYRIKLTTNGSYPNVLEGFINEKLIDYVELNLKNGPKEYADSIGMKSYSISDIEKTLSILRKDPIDYTCSIYLTKEYHTMDSMNSLAEWIHGAKQMILYTDIESKDTLSSDLHNLDTVSIQAISDCFRKHVDRVEVR